MILLPHVERVTLVNKKRGMAAVQLFNKMLMMYQYSFDSLISTYLSSYVIAFSANLDIFPILTMSYVLISVLSVC